MCLSVCSRGPCTEPQPRPLPLYRTLALPPLYRTLTPLRIQNFSPAPDMFKLVKLGFHCAGSHPKHVQTCSLWSTYCQQAGSFHAAEMPSCLFIPTSHALLFIEKSIKVFGSYLSRRDLAWRRTSCSTSKWCIV